MFFSGKCFYCSSPLRKSESFSVLNKHIKVAVIKVMLGLQVSIPSLACANRQQVQWPSLVLHQPLLQADQETPRLPWSILAPAAGRPETPGLNANAETEGFGSDGF